MGSTGSKYLFLGVLLVVIVALLYTSWLPGEDWNDAYRPAALAMVHGESPYSIHTFFNAPWTLLPIIPLALLPTKVGQVLFFLMGVACFAYIGIKLRARPVSFILFLTSYPVFSCLAGGGLDWLPMLSFVTSPPLALVFAAIKPQIGIGVALYWLIFTWELGGIRLILRWFSPVFFLFVVSSFAYGFWFLKPAGIWDRPFNISLFPYLIPLGIYLLATRRPEAGYASGVFFAPYHTMYSLAAPLVALFEFPQLLLIAWLVLWTLPILTWINQYAISPASLR